MKQKLALIILLLLLFKCKLTKEPGPKPSWSIKDSKDNKVFLYAYMPQDSFFRIEKKSYKIKEAWVEHSHLDADKGNTPLPNGYDFVMTFYKDTNDYTDLKSYTKNLSLGNSKIWFFIKKDEVGKDTLVLYYREKIDAKEQKTFLLFKKNDIY